MPVNKTEVPKKDSTTQEEREKFGKLEDLLEDARENNDNLIDVLHKAQKIFGHVSREVQIRVAEGLGIPLSEVYSVVSFYSLFSTEPRGKYTIEVCMGTACYVKGSQDILDKLNDELNIEPGQTSEDGRFTLESTRCIGACGMAPVIVIGGDVHGRLDIDKLPELLDKYK